MRNRARSERQPLCRHLMLSPWVPCWMLTIGMLVGLSGCSSSDGSPPKSEPETLPTISAEVLMVEPRPWPKVVRAQGSLVADEVTVVGSKVAGRVQELHVDLGDVVRAGEPLATLDRADFRLHVEQAEAQLAQARSAVGLKPGVPVEQLDPENAPPVRQEKAVWDQASADLKRAAQLRASNSITQSEFDQIAAAERVAEARLASALNGVYEKIALIGVRQAELSLARERYEEAVVRAPFDGLIQQKHVAPGAYVQVGNAVATIVRTNPLRYRGTLPERHAQDLALGQAVRLQIESVGEPRIVEVTRISPALDPLSRSLVFEALVANDDIQLRAGLFAEADVVVDPEAQALVVPHSAVVEFAGAEKIWKVVDGVLGEQPLLTGQRRPEGIQILEGLTPGDMILHDASLGQVARLAPLDASLAIRRSEPDTLLGGSEIASGSGSIVPPGETD